MKRVYSIATRAVGAVLMIQAVFTEPDASTDPRIDPQVRAFLRDIDKDSSPFWEHPSPGRKKF